jgi:hypothetical protein
MWGRHVIFDGTRSEFQYVAFRSTVCCPYSGLLEIGEMTNILQWVYRCFILYTGSYMFRQ